MSSTRNFLKKYKGGALYERQAGKNIFYEWEILVEEKNIPGIVNKHESFTSRNMDDIEKHIVQFYHKQGKEVPGDETHYESRSHKR